MKLSLPTGIAIAAIAWIVLYLILGVTLWVAFVVAGAIILASLVGGGGRKFVSG